MTLGCDRHIHVQWRTRNPLRLQGVIAEVVAKGGFEPPTQGFSVFEKECLALHISVGYCRLKMFVYSD